MKDSSSRLRFSSTRALALRGRSIRARSFVSRADRSTTARADRRKKGGPAYQFDRTVFFTDFDNYLTGGATSPIGGVSGPVRTDNRRPNNLRFTTAIQREIGKNIVVDAAYVGTRSKYQGRGRDINQIPFGRRFDPAFRDPTVRRVGHQSRCAAGCVPAPDSRVWRHHHQRVDRMVYVRLDAAAGDTPLHGPIRDGGQLYLGAWQGRRGAQ